MVSNRDSITVTILGSGTCVPSLKRSSCSVMMEIGTTKMLFDSGPGTMRRLLEADTTIFDIGYIFYSHFHPDHTAEFVPFLFATKYPDMGQRKFPLTVIAGVGFSDFYDKLTAVYGSWIEMAPGMFHIQELNNNRPDHHSFEAFQVDSVPVAHNKESIAFRLTTAAGKSVIYSGDTDYTEDLVNLAREADVLICESALPDEFQVNGHLTPSLAGKIATRAGVKKLVLTHFYPECDQVDIAQQCRKTYSGPLVLAEDLMRIEIDS